jgi:hypothetical protein
MTSMLHRFGDNNRLQQRLQRTQLRSIARSLALQTALAESYVGLPLGGADVPRVSRTAPFHHSDRAGGEARRA